MHEGTRPRVSVVIENRTNGPQLIRSLDSLVHQTLRSGMEVIVCDAGIGDPRMDEYPGFCILRFAEQESTPTLLKAGLLHATGDIIVVTSTLCSFPTDWVDKTVQAHCAASECAVIGGAVTYDGQYRFSRWAAYFADYGPFLPATPRCQTSILAGCHVSYKRAVMEQAFPLMREGYWKVFLHGEFEKQGIRFLFDPRLVCSIAVKETPMQFASLYYRNAREYAAMRSRGISSPARMFRIATCAPLPLVLLLRRLRPLWRTSSERSRIAASIPVLWVFLLFWAAGELAGYSRALFGSDVS